MRRLIGEEVDRSACTYQNGPVMIIAAARVEFRVPGGDKMEK